MIDKARAIELRSEGWTLQAIGDDLGVSRERIRQIVGNAEKPSVCQSCGAPIKQPEKGRHRLYCSQSCRNKSWNDKHQNACSSCGTDISPQSKECVECMVARYDRERRKKNARLVELWNDGYSMKEMAEMLDTTPGTVSVQIARAKHEGYEFPPRRAGWKGHTSPTIGAPEVPPKTRRQVVERMHHAIRYGRLVRPDSCERCGKSCHPDGHHHDYSKPLDVEWLCRSCHMAHHAAERTAA